MLESTGAVLVEGAKWCGKTQSSLQIANSFVFMQDPDEGPGYLAMADTKPSLLLEGEPPLLIDEWQMAPVIWDAVRFAVDKRGLTGQFILTGSATPSDNATSHSGTGRITRMLMRPMSLFESNESNGKVSIKDLFGGNTDIAAKVLESLIQICLLLIQTKHLSISGYDDNHTGLKKLSFTSFISISPKFSTDICHKPVEVFFV